MGDKKGKARGRALSAMTETAKCLHDLGDHYASLEVLAAMRLVINNSTSKSKGVKDLSLAVLSKIEEGVMAKALMSELTDASPRH